MADGFHHQFHCRVNTEKKVLSGFSKWERGLAKTIERFPRLREAIKEPYKRAAYWICRDSGFRYELHHSATLMTPQEWAGLPESPGEWFFGYYDKPPWSPAMDMAVFHRSLEGKATVMILDRRSKAQFPIGSSAAWNWQQGSMAQWVPNQKSNLKVVFNAAEAGVLGCRVVDLKRQTNRFITWPIQTLHPSGREALTLNYRRLARLRPDYGYSTKVRNFSANQNPEQDGIWRVDLANGSADLVLSIARLARQKPTPEMGGAQHKINHLIYSPLGTRFAFLHRFIGATGKFSRLYVANPDGNDLKLLMDERMVSHYHWRDNTHLLVWGRTSEKGDHYYLVDVNTRKREIIGEGELDRYGDGHCSFSPDGRWIVTDTYPDRARQQRLILFDTHTGKCIIVGRFFSPWAFTHTTRCDLHPRWSHDGLWISIDSAHEGQRRTYFLDVSQIVEGV
jgi:hypothetical protein